MATCLHAASDIMPVTDRDGHRDGVALAVGSELWNSSWCQLVLFGLGPRYSESRTVTGLQSDSDSGSRAGSGTEAFYNGENAR